MQEHLFIEKFNQINNLWVIKAQIPLEEIFTQIERKYIFQSEGTEEDLKVNEFIVCKRILSEFTTSAIGKFKPNELTLAQETKISNLIEIGVLYAQKKYNDLQLRIHENRTDLNSFFRKPSTKNQYNTGQIFPDDPMYHVFEPARRL